MPRKRNGSLSQEQVLDCALQICDALRYLQAHNPPIVYRDLKPSNIMWKSDGGFKLIDFGTAIEFRPGEKYARMGTRGFGAPEQLREQSPVSDQRSDIYSLGATMYCLLTGQTPSVELMQKHPVREFNPTVSIGLPESNLGRDIIELTRDNNGFIVADCNTQYGVFVNGVRIKRSCKVTDGDFISVQGVSMYYKDSRLYTDKNLVMELRDLPAYIYKGQQSHFIYPDFNRNTRIQYIIPEDEIEIKQPPQKPNKNRRSLWLTILPQVYKSMAAPLGVKANDEIVYLDISDKGSAHGPHGLVAGTTGSGKSEILQTYVLSMATLFHPYEVGFVIIDFKGGGMANQFKDLPHLMGTITNIDGREITRSLLSTKAELVKRQTLFAAAGVNHINDYIKLYKKGEVTQPLPHLIMIVDEFAELKAEYPDFMKEIISAARIGRTLGIHLILATQKPAGVVDNQIWSNSKFKLCLKVQTKEDSNEVIKTPLAAEIKEPGRAYFQVGNNEVFELFQSAFSGAKVTEGSSERPVELYELNKWGKRKLVYTNKTSQTREDAPTELEEIVEHVHNYCAAHGIARLPGICLPPLPDTLRADRLSRFEKDICKGIIIPIGMYDDPENQIQGNYEVNFTASNTYIIGSPQSGKTTLLQTIILQIMN